MLKSKLMPQKEKKMMTLLILKKMTNRLLMLSLRERMILKVQNVTCIDGELSFKGAPFSIPENEKSPLKIFQMFWNPSLSNYIADQTNLYSVQKLEKCICKTESEIRKFIGTQILMSIVKLPKFEMY